MADFSLTFVFLVWIVGFGSFFYLVRNQISNYVYTRSKLPRFVNYYLILFPFVLIEEYLTCELPFFECIIITVPAFFVMFFILYFLQKTFKLSEKASIITFGIMGWVNEMILVGRLFVLGDIVVIVLFSVLTFLIYGVLAILPSAYFNYTQKREL